MAVDLHAGLYSWAQTVGAIAAIIGTPPRFYPVAGLESETLPFVVYEEDQDEEPHVQDAGATVTSSDVRVACIAADVAGARLLAEAFRTALTPPGAAASFSGLMGSVTVQKVLWRGATPAYQWQEQQFAVDVTFKFWYSLS